jgi:3D (Asp-Asp-Asp) domain-containing protein
MSFSNYTENALLTYLMGTLATMYVGYGTASAGEDGSTAAEPSSGTNYARKAYGAYTVTAVGTDAQKVTNNAAITFDPASSSQGTITHVYFYDALTSGNFLGEVSFAELSLDNFSAITGSQLEFAIGQCAITLD